MNQHEPQPETATWRSHRLRGGVERGLPCLVVIAAVACAGSHSAPPQGEPAGDGEAGPAAGTSATPGAAGPGPRGGNVPSNDPLAEPAPTSFDAGIDASDAAPDAATATDAAGPCRAPARQEVVTAMNAVKDDLNACFSSSEVLFAAIAIDPETGRVVTVQISGGGGTREHDCAAAAILEGVRLAPFCLPDDAGLFRIRYPYRIAGTAPPVGDDDAGSARDEEDGGVAGSGTLRLNSRPWSVVTIDGVTIGNTPQLQIELSAGEHIVVLVNEELGLHKTIVVEIAAGQIITLVVALTE